MTVIKRALISVSDKTGLVELGQALSNHRVEILSTGGSAKTLSNAGIPVIDVSDYTDFPEMMGGRVKTLHPKVHGGILALRDNNAHQDEMRQHKIDQIDLVVVNLYPFEETVARDATFDECIENIDIGGPTLIRSAAKNHAFVTVVVETSDYSDLIQTMLENNGATTPELRRRLAAKAYTRTGSYDAAISNWFTDGLDDTFPESLFVTGKRNELLRYGENPHQEAAFFINGEARPGVATAVKIQGKELSYNNLSDTDAAIELVSEFDALEKSAVAIIKHANPCGVAIAKTLPEAYRKALACDPVSAFGGIIALNRTLDIETAIEISKIFTEVIIAPDADSAARSTIAKKNNLRLLITGGLPDPTAQGMTIKSLAGGYLLQTRDPIRVGDLQLKVVTKRTPSVSEMTDLRFAFTVAKHVKSNAIVFAKDGATVGVGAGQMSRLDSARIAAIKAEEAARQAGLTELRTRDCVAASDAFFPFADGLMATIEAGATAVIQPGGSMRDEEVIAAADEAGLAMVFTGIRHFRH